MKPSIGRIVHYAFAEWDLAETHKHLVGKTRPALIVETFGNERSEAIENGSAVNLVIFPDGGNDGLSMLSFRKTSVLFSENHGRPGTWSWPPRVE